MPATLTHPSPEAQTRWAAVLARAKAIGWSQNRLARRLRKNPGHFSRVVRGERQSRALLVQAERVVAKAEMAA